jgi:hypothetical protein
MAKVITERPRAGHGNESRKWGRRLGKHEYDAEDHGATRAPVARRNQYGWNAKRFSDLLGPLRRYLRKQVGRPWDTVWSEISHTLDSRSLSGQHVFNHIGWEVEQHARVGTDGRVYHNRWSGQVPVSGLYIDPRTRLLCYARKPSYGYGGSFAKAQAVLRAFGIYASTAADIRRYRVDDLRVWERHTCGWLVHTYRLVPEQIVPVVRPGGSRGPLYCPPRYEREATRQAGKRDVERARRILSRDPLSTRAE